MDKRKVLGSNIKAERNRKNLSQAALGEKTNISANSICSIERGTQIPSAFTLFDIAKALAIDINELFKGIE